MSTFRILIPNKRKKSFHYVSIFIFVLNLIIFLKVFLLHEAFQKWLGAFGVLVCLSGIIFSILKLNQRPGGIHIIHFVLLTLAWIILPAIVPAICIGAFAIITFIAARERWLVVNKRGIQYPSLPPKLISWPEVNSVILKDHVLTIDLKDNRFIQMVISNNEFAGSELDFQNACQSWISEEKQTDKS